MEKFSHLEDKIYRTVELCKTLKAENDTLTEQLSELRRETRAGYSERERLETQVERLLADRDAMRLKVEAMLDAIAVLEMEAEMTAKR